MDYWQRQNTPKWKTAEMVEGDIVSVVNATGTVKPVLQISVGAFVSGPIDSEYQLKDRDGNPVFDKDGKPKQIVDFNEDVKKGDVLAKIQDVIYKANKDRDQANLDSRVADVERGEGPAVAGQKRRVAGPRPAAEERQIHRPGRDRQGPVQPHAA